MGAQDLLLRTIGNHTQRSFSLLRWAVLREVHAVAASLFVFDHLEIVGVEAKWLQYPVPKLYAHIELVINIDRTKDNPFQQQLLTFFSFPHISDISSSWAALVRGGKVLSCARTIFLSAGPRFVIFDRVL